MKQSVLGRTGIERVNLISKHFTELKFFIFELKTKAEGPFLQPIFAQFLLLGKSKKSSLLDFTENLAEATERIIDICLNKGSTDNMTLIIIAFNSVFSE